MKLPDGLVHRLGASGNVKGGIWEGRKPMLAAAHALPRDQAGLWEGCAGKFLGLLLSPRPPAYLDYEHSERGFLVGCTSPGEVMLDT